MLTRLYNHYAKDIYTYFYIRTFGNDTAAEDLSQETFCAIIDYAPRIKSKVHITSTVFCIARNKLVDYQRKIINEKKKTTGLKEKLDISQDIISDLYNKQRLFLFNLAVDTLNPLYKQVYDMFYIEEKAVKEIAIQCRKTYKAIENILARIRIKLKKEMMRFAKDFFTDEEGG